MTEFNLISTQTINTIRSSSFVYKEQLRSPQNSLKKLYFHGGRQDKALT